MSSLNIALPKIYDTHVLVYTFSSDITSSFLLLHLSFIHVESDHVSYMTDKSSCPIYYTLPRVISVSCSLFKDSSHYLIYTLIQSPLYLLSFSLCLSSFAQFLVTFVVCWRIYCLPYHNMVQFQHFLMTKT